MEIVYNIDNMKCDGCVKSVTEGIQKLNGVSNVVVSLINSSITFESESEDNTNEVKLKLIELGYPIKDESSLLDKAKSFLNK